MPRNNNVRPRYTQMEMYAGHVTCCPLLSHVAYAPRALLRLAKRCRTPFSLGKKMGQTDSRTHTHTDGRPIVTLHLPLNVASMTTDVH